MANPAFSDRGDTPTDYERALIHNSGTDEPRHVRQQLLLLAHRIGPDALCAVLDELGGMAALSLPSRATFFADLHREHRNMEIQQLAQSGKTSTEIARMQRVHRRTVDRALRASRVQRAVLRGTTPQWSKRSRTGRTR